MDGATAAQVAIPLSWFLSAIAGLAGVIGLMAREFFKLQNLRADDARKDTERVVDALNNNTNALNAIVASLDSGG